MHKRYVLDSAEWLILASEAIDYSIMDSAEPLEPECDIRRKNKEKLSIYNPTRSGYSKKSTISFRDGSKNSKAEIQNSPT